MLAGQVLYMLRHLSSPNYYSYLHLNIIKHTNSNNLFDYLRALFLNLDCQGIVD